MLRLVRSAGAGALALLGLSLPASTALAQPDLPTNAARASTTDPRATLRPGYQDAGSASWNLQHVVNVPKPAAFIPPDPIFGSGLDNTDMAFQGPTLFVGNYGGILIYDISTPSQPRLRSMIECPGGQGDVSIHGNLLFMSVEETRGRVDCGAAPITAAVSAERFRGVRIFDVSNLEAPRQVARVQTCRGSHTHTLVTDPRDAANVYVYVSGTAGVRPSGELADCVGGDPAENAEASSYFRIEVIKVPLAAPQTASVVTSSRFLLGLPVPPRPVARPSAEEIAEAGRRAADARARGLFTYTWDGVEEVLPQEVSERALQGVMAQQNRTGTPTAADSAAVRALIAQQVADGEARALRPTTGPTSCHDITVYPEVGLAGGACDGYGILLDIRDPVNPKQIDRAGDANFAYWHSATFNNDATSIVFTDEWGGGSAARCRAGDRMEWGANALFRIEDGQRLRQTSYYKMPAAQTGTENCVAHNGSLVPVPGRDIMVQAWYQGGVSVFEFTDPAKPKEIAYFDRGPLSADQLVGSGYWSAYWYNGHLYATEQTRGLDVFRLTPSDHLTASEIAAAGTVQARVFNPQLQTKVVWAPSATLSQAYLDQATRAAALPSARVEAIRSALGRVDAARTPAQRRAAAAQISTAARPLATTARTSSDPDAVRRLQTSLETLAASMR